MDKIILGVFIAFLIFAGYNLLFYIPRLIGWFGALKPQKRIKNDKNERIAIVCPARNESVVIPKLLESISKQTYNREDYDLFVIVKDKSDPTIKMVEDFGGYVFVDEHQNCKGDALDFAFKSILRNYCHYEGLVVVDADCELDSHFLEEMNNSFASGRDVFQAKKNVKNYLYKNSISLASSCNGLIWTLIDDMGNRYKSDHEYTNMTIGTGIMLRMSLVKELGGWPYRDTVTEDMEFMNDCAIRGITTYYNSYCVMYVEEALSLNMTNKRRSRWLKGLIDSERIYKDRLSELTGHKNRKNRYFVTALDYVCRYIGSCVVFSLFNFGISIYLAFTYNPLVGKTMFLGLLGVAIIYISFFIMTLFCIICDHKNIKLPWYRKIILLFAHPVFYMGYIPIVFKALLTHRSSKWEAIERVQYDN